MIYYPMYTEEVTSVCTYVRVSWQQNKSLFVGIPQQGVSASLHGICEVMPSESPKIELFNLTFKSQRLQVAVLKIKPGQANPAPSRTSFFSPACTFLIFFKKDHY